MTTVTWILNLDADLELADPDGFAPSARLSRQTDTLAEQLLAAARAAAPAVRHVRLSAGSGPSTDGASSREASICQAWCPTPRARQAARERGGELPDAPSLQVLQRVNHRSFAAGLGVLLPDAAFVTSMQQLEEHLQGCGPDRTWLLKRPFGFSGRAQKRVRGLPTDGDWRWAEASMLEYGRGLMVEPFVAVVEEFALHGWLGPDGACLTGEVTGLRTDELGAWVRSEPRADLHEAEREQLQAAHALAAKALTQAGYHGPFSIDAYRYRERSGHLRFQALSELNARYSMGFFAGLGERVHEWAERVGRG